MSTEQSTKTCTRCGETKPFSEFHRQKSKRDGYRSHCKACRSLEVTGSEDEQARARERYWANRARHLEQKRRYYQENADAIRSKRAVFRDENREALREADRQWREANRELHRLRARVAGHRRRGAEGFHTLQDVRQLIEDQGGRCAYCERELNGSYHVDHMTPLSRGGTNDVLNLAITCPNCNQRKGSKTVEEFVSAGGG